MWVVVRVQERVLRIRCEEGTKEGKSFLGRERMKERRPLKSWAWGR
jgi:hypothetical protein